VFRALFLGFAKNAVLVLLGYMKRIDCILPFGRWIKGLLVIAVLVQSLSFSIHASMAFAFDDTSSQHEVSHSVEHHVRDKSPAEDDVAAGHLSDVAKATCLDDLMKSNDSCCAEYCSFSSFVFSLPAVSFFGGTSDLTAMEQAALLQISRLSLQRPPRI